jgi:hypothetical protein
MVAPAFTSEGYHPLAALLVSLSDLLKNRERLIVLCAMKRLRSPVLGSLRRLYFFCSLTTNLNEEKAANTKLNTIAVRKGVNKKASAA